MSPGVDLTLLDKIPHRLPWLRLDRVRHVDEVHVVVEKHVSSGDPFAQGGLRGTFLLELAAQAAACLMAARDRNRGGHLGYLVSARAWKFPEQAGPGDTIVIAVERQGELGGLVSFAARLWVGEREIASGSFSCAVQARAETATL